jgi:Lrp/AsnC family transcriptional regulator for asnA, asnC and gidA
MTNSESSGSAVTRPARPHIDPIEQRMIEILQLDGRKTTRQLAKECGVSELTARRKLRRLTNDDIIRIVATVDPFDVGYETPALIGLRVDPARLEEVAEAVSSLPNVVYVAATTGSIDLIVEVMARTNQDLADFLLQHLAVIPGVTASETNLVIRIFRQSWAWGIRSDA